MGTESKTESKWTEDDNEIPFVVPAAGGNEVSLAPRVPPAAAGTESSAEPGRLTGLGGLPPALPAYFTPTVPAIALPAPVLPPSIAAGSTPESKAQNPPHQPIPISFTPPKLTPLQIMAIDHYGLRPEDIHGLSSPQILAKLLGIEGPVESITPQAWFAVMLMPKAGKKISPFQIASSPKNWGVLEAMKEVIKRDRAAWQIAITTPIFWVKDSALISPAACWPPTAATDSTQTHPVAWSYTPSTATGLLATPLYNAASCEKVMVRQNMLSAMIEGAGYPMEGASYWWLTAAIEAGSDASMEQVCARFFNYFFESQLKFTTDADYQLILHFIHSDFLQPSSENADIYREILFSFLRRNTPLELMLGTLHTLCSKGLLAPDTIIGKKNCAAMRASPHAVGEIASGLHWLFKDPLEPTFTGAVHELMLANPKHAEDIGSHGSIFCFYPSPLTESDTQNLLDFFFRVPHQHQVFVLAGLVELIKAGIVHLREDLLPQPAHAEAVAQVLVHLHQNDLLSEEAGQRNREALGKVANHAQALVNAFDYLQGLPSDYRKALRLNGDAAQAVVRIAFYQHLFDLMLQYPPHAQPVIQGLLISYGDSRALGGELQGASFLLKREPETPIVLLQRKPQVAYLQAIAGSRSLEHAKGIAEALVFMQRHPLFQGNAGEKNCQALLCKASRTVSIERIFDVLDGVIDKMVSSQTILDILLSYSDQQMEELNPWVRVGSNYREEALGIMHSIGLLEAECGKENLKKILFRIFYKGTPTILAIMQRKGIFEKPRPGNKHPEKNQRYFDALIENGAIKSLSSDGYNAFDNIVDILIACELLEGENGHNNFRQLVKVIPYFDNQRVILKIEQWALQARPGLKKVSAFARIKSFFGMGSKNKEVNNTVQGMFDSLMREIPTIQDRPAVNLATEPMAEHQLFMDMGVELRSKYGLSEATFPSFGYRWTLNFWNDLAISGGSHQDCVAELRKRLDKLLVDRPDSGPKDVFNVLQFLRLDAENGRFAVVSSLKPSLNESQILAQGIKYLGQKKLPASYQAVYENIIKAYPAQAYDLARVLVVLHHTGVLLVEKNKLDDPTASVYAVSQLGHLPYMAHIASILKILWLAHRLAPKEQAQVNANAILEFIRKKSDKSPTEVNMALQHLGEVFRQLAAVNRLTQPNVERLFNTSTISWLTLTDMGIVPVRGSIFGLRDVARFAETMTKSGGKLGELPADIQNKVADFLGVSGGCILPALMKKKRADTPKSPSTENQISFTPSGENLWQGFFFPPSPALQQSPHEDKSSGLSGMSNPPVCFSRAVLARYFSPLIIAAEEADDLKRKAKPGTDNIVSLDSAVEILKRFGLGTTQGVYPIRIGQLKDLPEALQAVRAPKIDSRYPPTYVPFVIPTNGRQHAVAAVIDMGTKTIRVIDSQMKPACVDEIVQGLTLAISQPGHLASGFTIVSPPANYPAQQKDEENCGTWACMNLVGMILGLKWKTPMELEDALRTGSVEEEVLPPEALDLIQSIFLEPTIFANPADLGHAGNVPRTVVCVEVYKRMMRRAAQAVNEEAQALVTEAPVARVIRESGSPAVVRAPHPRYSLLGFPTSVAASPPGSVSQNPSTTLSEQK